MRLIHTRVVAIAAKERRRSITRALAQLGVMAALAVATVLGPSACEQGAQGDRCNPALVQPGGPSGVPQYNEDECNSGLACTVPPTCVIAICCPKQPPYSDPNCACLADPGAPCACTVPGLDDAGEDGATGDAGGDVGDGSLEASTAVDASADAPIDASRDSAAE